MEITGSQTLAASRQKVWDALNDPDVLKQCLPGCESVEKINAEQYTVIMAAAIGPLRARFNGTLRMTDATPPSACTMVFEGQGGPVGFGKGSSSVELTETSDGTQLSYTASAQVGGKLAQVGSRLIDSVARKMADDFFKAFKKQLTAPTDSQEAEASQVVPTTSPAKSETRVQSAVTSGHCPSSSTHEARPRVMVPGWWLLVATALGSALTVVGTLLMR